ncbi:hypothetical protein KSS87_018899 [Heliosperma pusillum]|nr:hypothetical protein KSS87_018899 [Heliosperma pusillum]
MAKGETKEIIKWNFIGNEEDVNNNNNNSNSIITTNNSNNNNNMKSYTIREARTMIMETMNPNDKRSMLALGHGDPSIFPCFRTCRNAEDAVVEVLRSVIALSTVNLFKRPAHVKILNRAVAEYLSYDLPYTLSASGVFLTVGCTQAIDVTLSMLSRPGANILLPRPGYPYYEIRSAYIGLEARHFDLVPENGWEIDVNSLEAQADSNTVAMVLINPGNPCGNVFTYKHLQKVAEVARKLGIMVISDEVYGQLTFGNNPFVPMGEFASIVPVITLGSLSKRWIVPGWRLGWLVVNDTQGILLKSGVVERIDQMMNKSPDPVSFIQAALPKILKWTDEKFFTKIIDMLRYDANICYEKLKEIPALSCPYKADGAMFMMVR